MTIRITTAPPIIPPIVGVLSPPEPPPDGFVFSIVEAVGDEGNVTVILDTIPSAFDIGDPKIVSLTSVVVNVCGFRSASVVVKVSVSEKVDILVA